MKALVWVLNIIQFLIAYFISYALYFYGILELLPPETGLIGKGVWPAAAIGMALLPWKYYNRLSNYIISQITNIEAPKTNMSNMSKPKPSKLLYTFFFGYAALKWRRLIRTLILIPSVGGLISGIVAGPINFFNYNPTSGYVTNYEEDVYRYYCDDYDKKNCFKSFNNYNRYKKEFLIEHFGGNIFTDILDDKVYYRSVKNGKIYPEKDILNFYTPRLKELLSNGTLIEIKKAEDVIDTNIFSLLEIGEEVYVKNLSKIESLRKRFYQGSLITFGTIGIFIGVSLVIALISWLIKPFVVKEG